MALFIIRISISNDNQDNSMNTSFKVTDRKQLIDYYPLESAMANKDKSSAYNPSIFD